MTQTKNDHLQRFHERFDRDHARLRDDLLARLDASSDTNPQRWSTFMKRSLLAASIAMLLAVFITMMFMPTSNVAWAQMLTKLDETTSMVATYDVTTYDAEGNAVEVFGPIKSYRKDPGLYRYEQETKGGLGTKITSIRPTDDGNGSISVTLLHDMNHGAINYNILHPTYRALENSNGNGYVEILMDRLRSVTEDEALRIREEPINGEPAVLFECSMQRFLGDNMPKGLPESTQELMQEKMLAAFENLPPMRIWVSKESSLPVRIEEPSPSFSLKDGQYQQMNTYDIRWNVDLPDDLFQIEVPEDWTLLEHGWVSVGGSDMIQSGESVVRYGLRFKPEVTFALTDESGRVLATEADILGVPTLSFGRMGRDNPEERQVQIEFSGEAKQRMAEALGDRVETLWLFNLNDQIIGSVNVSNRRDINFPGLGAHINGFPIHNLTIDQFIDAYLVVPDSDSTRKGE